MKTKITLLLMSLLLSAATSFAQTVASGTTGDCTWTLTGSESIPASPWPAGVYLLRAQGHTVKVAKN
jgi:hypothetical protein